MMELEELVRTSASGRSLDRPDFILPNSIPLRRSQTFESNGREGTDTRIGVHRRRSNDALRESPRKRLSLRTGAHDLRLPPFEALGISARFSRYSPFTVKPNLPHHAHHSSRSPSPPPLSPKSTSVLPTVTRSAPPASASHYLCPTHGFAFPLTPPDEKPTIDFSSHLNKTTSNPSSLAPSSITMSGIQELKTTATAPSDTPTSSSTKGPSTTLSNTVSLGNTLPMPSNEQNQDMPSSWLDSAIAASSKHPFSRPPIRPL
jgi:hypothetical protein